MKYLFIFTFCLLPQVAVATVGGGQYLEVLGYDAPEQKLYILRHYQDGRGRLPQLYYAQLNSQHPEKWIEVQSLYIDPVTHEVNYDQEPTRFNSKLAQIQKRLQNLPITHPPMLQTIKIHCQNVTTFSSNFPIQYQFKYQLKGEKSSSPIYQAISYTPQLNVVKNYALTPHQKTLTVVQYVGIPFETGYLIEDAILW